MTPKEKCNELISDMCQNDFTITNINRMKMAAIIAVDEILLIVDIMDVCGEEEKSYEYWKKVKSEIKKL